MRTKSNQDVELFFDGPEINDLCQAIVSHPRYEKHQKVISQHKGIQEFAISIARKTVVQKIEVLSRTDRMRVKLSNF